MPAFCHVHDMYHSLIWPGECDRMRAAETGDDEREAPIQAAQEAFEKHEDAPTWRNDPRGRDAALRWHMHGFKDGLNTRRTVQSKPSDAEVAAAMKEWSLHTDAGRPATLAMRAALRAAAAIRELP